MEESAIISILALVVSVLSAIFSVIALWLTELRGPNIVLLAKPKKLKLTDGSFQEASNQNSTRQWFSVENFYLLFANHGGRSGTIKNLEMIFSPSESFLPFFRNYSLQIEKKLTIKEGENRDIEGSFSIQTKNWKKTALAEVLDPELEINEILDKAIQRSKENFQRFCDFFEEPQEIGKLVCNINYTKGRFKTRIKKEELFTISLSNQYNKTLYPLTKCLLKWDYLSPKKAELLREIMDNLKDLQREVKRNIERLGGTVNDNNILESTLQIEVWTRIVKIKDDSEKKVNLFLLKKEEGLLDEIRILYKLIEEYNNKIIELQYMGDMRRKEDFSSVNLEKDQLIQKVEDVYRKINPLLKIK